MAARNSLIRAALTSDVRPADPALAPHVNQRPADARRNANDDVVLELVEPARLDGLDTQRLTVGGDDLPFQRAGERGRPVERVRRRDADEQRFDIGIAGALLQGHILARVFGRIDRAGRLAPCEQGLKRRRIIQVGRDVVNEGAGLHDVVLMADQARGGTAGEHADDRKGQTAPVAAGQRRAEAEQADDERAGTGQGGILVDGQQGEAVIPVALPITVCGDAQSREREDADHKRQHPQQRRTFRALEVVSRHRSIL